MPPISFNKKGELVTLWPKGGESAIFKKDSSGLLKSFTDRFKGALRPKAENPLAEENKEIGRSCKETEEGHKEFKKAEQAALNKQKAEEKIKKLVTGFRDLKQGELLLKRMNAQLLKIQAK